MRRLAVLLVALLAPGVASAVSPKIQQDVADQAARLMPSSLRWVLSQNLGRLHEGVSAAAAATDAQSLRAGGPGSRGELDEIIQQQSQRLLDMLAAKAPMSNVAYEMGVLSQYVTLAADPTVSGNGDPRESEWAGAFESYVESRQPRFRLVFDGYYSPALTRDDVRGFVGECEQRSQRHYQVLTMMYVKEDGSIARNDFDDRSPVFGVAALSYAHAIADTAKLWLYIWIRSNGDSSGLPFPQALQVGPAVQQAQK